MSDKNIDLEDIEQSLIDSFSKNLKALKTFTIDKKTMEYISKLEDIPELSFKYAQIEQMMKDFGIHFTKRTFLFYIKQGLLPESTKSAEIKNQATYGIKHILLYILISEMRDIVSLEQIKNYFSFLKPKIKNSEIVKIIKNLLMLEEGIAKSMPSSIKDQIENMKPLLVSEIIGDQNSRSLSPSEEVLLEYDVRIFETLIMISGAKASLKIFNGLLQEYTSKSGGN